MNSMIMRSFFASRRRHSRCSRGWSSDVCSSDLVFQRADGSRKPVRGEYCLRGPNEIGVRLGPYDHSRPVVIDPVLSYSTFLGGVGGSTAFEIGRASCRERV